MGLFVSCEVRGLSEPLVTAWISADVGLLTSMSSQMCPQIEVQREPLEAQLAFEWFLACMDQLMPLKFGVVQESLTTSLDRADVLPLSMGHKVLPERRGICKDFATVYNMTSKDLVSSI